jgi:hypothetical protein
MMSLLQNDFDKNVKFSPRPHAERFDVHDGHNTVPLANNLRTGGSRTIPSPRQSIEKDILEPSLPLLTETVRKLQELKCDAVTQKSTPKGSLGRPHLQLRFLTRHAHPERDALRLGDCPGNVDTHTHRKAGIHKNNPNPAN